jgi:hypothetical protein
VTFLGGFVIGGGICSVIAWNAGIKEGMAKAARLWRGQRSA